MIQDSRAKADKFFVKKDSSEKLLQRFQLGGEKAPFEIHARYQDRVIRLARKRLLSVLNSKIDADDIAQETFTAFFAMADRDEVKWKERGDLWRLLAGIAINKANQKLDHFSTKKRDLRSESQLNEMAQGLTKQSHTDGEIGQLAELVEHILVSEKPLVATVLKLRLAGFSFEEVSQQVGRSTRTIRRLMERLKSKLIADQEITSTLVQARSESAPDFQVEHADYSDFHLLRMIGQGSFAKVYLAKQISTGNYFAIKAIKKKWLGSAAARKSFYREVELLMVLSDPSFVKTYGIGQLPNGGCFLVLQWIEGKSLGCLIETASLEDRTRWMKQIRKAVKRLHAANIAHGDIDMNNVLIDKLGQVKLVDFGLARRVSNRSLDFQFDLNRVERLSKLVIAVD